MRIYYTDHFELPLPDSHRFPMSKYRLLRRRIVGDQRHQKDVLVVPAAATDQQLLTCHTAGYLRAVVSGTLTQAQIRRIGFPYSSQLVERSRRSTGATIAAANAALEDGISVNLAGGTHHAMSDAGEGYCVFNDAAVAIRSLRMAGRIERACVIDLDVHQGNGTAQIAASDLHLFTLSMHGERNFPLRKFPSDLDIDLPDGCDDDFYLKSLDKALNKLSAAGPFDLAIFLAGADPYVADRLGRLSLTKAGLARRDAAVMDWTSSRGIPLAIAMAGGYSPDVNDIVDIHAATVAAASLRCRRST